MPRGARDEPVMLSPMLERSWHVNGTLATVAFAADARLLDVLRDTLAMTGAKEGCGEGECGACSVVVDGELRVSCLQLAAALPDGTTITTAEGVVHSTTGERLRRMMLDRGGVQCGFCTPGMMVAAWWYLETKPPIDARTALAGNLCRCTGYQSICEAVEAAANAEERMG